MTRRTSRCQKRKRRIEAPPKSFPDKDGQHFWKTACKKIWCRKPETDASCAITSRNARKSRHLQGCSVAFESCAAVGASAEPCTACCVRRTSTALDKKSACCGACCERLHRDSRAARETFGSATEGGFAEPGRILQSSNHKVINQSS